MHVKDNLVVVCMGNRYGLDGFGFEPQWSQKVFLFPHPSRPAQGPSHPSVSWASEDFPSDKSEGGGVTLCRIQDIVSFT
jgi:hypothetical protein